MDYTTGDKAWANITCGCGATRVGYVTYCAMEFDGGGMLVPVPDDPCAACDHPGWPDALSIVKGGRPRQPWEVSYDEWVDSFGPGEKPGGSDDLRRGFMAGWGARASGGASVGC